MLTFIYNILLFLFYPVYFIYRIFNSKFKKREITSKNHLRDLMKLKKKNLRVWIHASSMGEFEQAKPIIELLKQNKPELEIICSFFSPSGYENQKNYSQANMVVYLPFDYPNRVSKFLEVVQPDIALFVRYDIWRNYLTKLKYRKTPAFLICATVPGNNWLNKIPFLSYTKSNFNLFDMIFSFNELQYKNFQKYNLSTPVISSKDARYDRIIAQVETSKITELLPNSFTRNKPFVVVLGSSWSEDENLILKFIKNNNLSDLNIKFIIVPHEPTEKHLIELKSKILNSTTLSEYLKSPESDVSILVIDSIGKLLMLYKYANLAYIGGGFGVGVHSVAEPAGYSIPLACGPNFKNSPDAIELSKIGSLTLISTSADFEKWIIKYVESDEKRNYDGTKSGNYINSMKGASFQITEFLLKQLNNLQKISHYSEN